MFKIAIDLGHGWVKAVSENGRSLIFPSLVGEGFERQLQDVFGTGRKEGKSKEYDVIVDGKRYFVGKLALAESWNATRAFDESRLSHFSTPVLYGTAAALLMGNTFYPTHLAAGLPFELFKTQRKDLQDLLAGMRLNIEVAGLVRPRQVSFDKVSVVPQAAGAFYSAILDDDGTPTSAGQKLLQEGGMAAIVDTGYKTTDFMLVDLESLEVVESLCGTINMAMNDVFVAAQRELQQMSGDVIDLLEVEQAVTRGKFWFKGREYPVNTVFADCVEDLAETIADRLRVVWKERQKYIRVLFLAGGGGSALAPAFGRRQMPVHVLPNGQFANARGFLSLAARKEAAERKVRLA
jgi:plasmid segregation protein ParM